MIGRQVINTNHAFTLEELEQFMKEHWNKDQYNDFFIGRPTPASIEEYILLPATPRYLVAVYARKGGSLFRKENKVILAVADTPDGAKENLARSVRTGNAVVSVMQMASLMSGEKERKGPAEEALQNYAAHMREILEAAGYLAQ